MSLTVEQAYFDAPYLLSKEQKLSVRMRGEGHPQHLLLEEEVREMHEMARDGAYGLEDIADNYGIDPLYLRLILKGKVWRHCHPEYVEPVVN